MENIINNGFDIVEEDLIKNKKKSIFSLFYRACKIANNEVKGYEGEYDELVNEVISRLNESDVHYVEGYIRTFTIVGDYDDATFSRVLLSAFRRIKGQYVSVNSSDLEHKTEMMKKACIECKKNQGIITDFKVFKPVEDFVDESQKYPNSCANAIEEIIGDDTYSQKYVRVALSMMYTTAYNNLCNYNLLQHGIEMVK